MAGANIAQIWDRLHALVSGEAVVDDLALKLDYKRSDDPFTFDREPRQGHRGGVYRIESQMAGTGGLYLGGDRNELHQIDIWLLQPYQRNPHGVFKRLLVDLDTLRTLVERDGLRDIDYTTVDGSVSSAVREAPGPDAIYLLGHLGAIVDFDRDPDTAIEQQ